MKRYITYIIAVLLLAGCSDTGGGSDEPEMVRVNLLLPKKEVPGTRKTRAPQYESLTQNETIRLFVYKYESDDFTQPDESNFVGQWTFRVEESDHSTRLCTVDPDTGAYIADMTNTDFHLPASTYVFYAIHPAIALPNWESVFGGSRKMPSYTIYHGNLLSLYASEAQKFYIGQNAGEVVGGTPGFFNITPEPFRILTSKISFKLWMSEDGSIEDLDMASGGVVIDGLAPNVYRENFFIGFTSLYQQQSATPGTFTMLPVENNGYYTYLASDPDKSGKETFNFSAEIIPTATPTDVSFTFNCLVNGGAIKTYFYNFGLNAKEFEQGVHYLYDVEVKLGGLIVTGWKPIGWETIIPD